MKTTKARRDVYREHHKTHRAQILAVPRDMLIALIDDVRAELEKP